MTARVSANAPATAGSPATIRICLCASIVISGMTLRRYGFALGLPSAIVKYGGSILWGAMVFFLVAIVAPRLSRRNIVLISTVIAVCVELFRLVHAPWLDEFRLTLVGTLLLGRIFSLWDILAYGGGIALALGLDHLAGRVFTGPPVPHCAS
jgi:hypothetical protein